MKIKILYILCILTLFIHSNSFAQEEEKYIENLVLIQGTDNIALQFNLKKAEIGGQYYSVKPIFKINGKPVQAKTLTGDYGEKVEAGKNKRIVWEILKDLTEAETIGKFTYQVKVEIYAPVPPLEPVIRPEPEPTPEPETVITPEPEPTREPETVITPEPEPTPEPKPKKSYFVIGAHFTPSLNTISSNLEDVQVYRFRNETVDLKKNTPIALDFGATVDYFFSPKIGVGFAINSTTFASKFKVNTFETSYDSQDIDGDNYERYFEVNNLEETWKVNFINFSPYLSLGLSTNNKIKTYLHIGYQFNISSGSQLDYQGDFSSSNYYSNGFGDIEGEVTLFAIDSDDDGIVAADEAGNFRYGLYENEQINESFDLSQAIENSGGIYAALGFWLPINKKLYFNITPQVTYGLGNTLAENSLETNVIDNLLLKQYDDYETLVQASDKSNRLGFGLELGFKWSFERLNIYDK